MRLPISPAMTPLRGSQNSMPNIVISNGQSPADTQMDADLTSFLKGRRLEWACRESTMRV
jgi:hypothetical protein